MIIKQLQQQGKDFAPRTVAEAVLVHHNANVVRLDQILSIKLENIESNEFNVTKEGTKVIIVHKNNIVPQPVPKATLVSFDSSGHITHAMPTQALKVVVNNVNYTAYDGNQEASINLRDDFEIKNNLIGLRWNYVGS